MDSSIERELTSDEALGIAWWNGLTVTQRASWFERAGTAVVAEAWAFFKNDRDAATDDDDRTYDSSFWFDEFTIPQYDYLVERGRITQAEADEYRKLREDRGLPMDFGQLTPRPDPAYEWIYRLGGPSLGEGSDVELHGLHWSARAHSEHGRLNCTTLDVPGGFLDREISRSHDGNGASWSATYKLPGVTGVYARASGKTESFDDAVAASTEVIFEPITLAGLQFYPSGWKARDLTAAFNGESLVIAADTTADNEPAFQWVLSLPEESAMYRLANLFESSQLRGRAPTAEVAAGDAIAAMCRVEALCSELVGSDPFAAGLQAGKAVVQADLVAFLFKRA